MWQHMVTHLATISLAELLEQLLMANLNGSTFMHHHAIQQSSMIRVMAAGKSRGVAAHGGPSGHNLGGRDAGEASCG